MGKGGGELPGPLPYFDITIFDRRQNVIYKDISKILYKSLKSECIRKTRTSKDKNNNTKKVNCFPLNYSGGKIYT